LPVLFIPNHLLIAGAFLDNLLKIIFLIAANLLNRLNFIFLLLTWFSIIVLLSNQAANNFNKRK
jgi:hypothetical protein